MEKSLNLNVQRMKEMATEEMKATNGGNGWGDLFWMCAEDIAEGYINLCREIWKYHVENGGADARIAIRLTH